MFTHPFPFSKFGFTITWRFCAFGSILLSPLIALTLISCTLASHLFLRCLPLVFLSHDPILNWCLPNTPSFPLEKSWCVLWVEVESHSTVLIFSFIWCFLCLFLTRVHPCLLFPLRAASPSTHMVADFGSQFRLRSIGVQSHLRILLGRECAPGDMPNNSTEYAVWPSRSTRVGV